MNLIRTCRTGIPFVFMVAFGRPAIAQDAVTLAEEFKPGHAYKVESVSKVSGKTAVPVEKGKPQQIIESTGSRRLVYDERILPADPGTVAVVRSCRETDLKRMTGTLVQEAGIRPSVRRMVIRAGEKGKAPFSPDGPMSWEELDFVKKDEFCPVFVPGLLPAGAVRPGQSWKASAAAVSELTAIEKIDDGAITVEFVGVTAVNQRRVARLKLSGALRGVDQDGPTRHKLDGTAYFDLDARMLTYLSLKGTQEQLDGGGQTWGIFEGQFVMTRSAGQLPGDLADASLRGLDLTPNVENTLLLFDSANLGVRFLYPRSWRVGAVQGKQVSLDYSGGGAGVLITVEPPSKVPTADEYLRESAELLKKDKAQVTGQEKPTRVRAEPGQLDRFSIDASFGPGKAVRIEYGVLRQTDGGVTIAATLPAAAVGELRTDAERIIRSLAITKKIEEK